MGQGGIAPHFGLLKIFFGALRYQKIDNDAKTSNI